MQRVSRLLAVTLTSAAAAALVASCATTPPTGPMGFFVTSAGPGNGGNLGGLAGADAHCQKLAAAAGAGSRTWRAYLSTSYIPPTHRCHHMRATASARAPGSTPRACSSPPMWRNCTTATT